MYKTTTIHYIVLAILVLSAYSCQQKEQATDNTTDTSTEEVVTSPEAKAFNKTLNYSPETSFEISVTSSEDGNVVNVQPKGHGDNALLTKTIEGNVTGAEAVDLNEDKFPEVLLYITGENNQNSMVAYSSNNGKSMSEVFVEDLNVKPDAAKGYRGGDIYLQDDNKLIRRFVTYLEEDADGSPTGPNRQITYKLVNGEASRLFVMDEVIEYPSR